MTFAIVQGKQSTSVTVFISSKPSEEQRLLISFLKSQVRR